MYQTRRPNLTQSKRRTTTAVRIVDADLLQTVWNNSQTRLQIAIRENFGHLRNRLHPVDTLRDTEYHTKVRC